MRILAPALGAALLLAGCSYQREGAGGALAEPGAGAPAPALGQGVAEVLAALRGQEPGGMRVELRDLRVSRVRDGAWEEISPADAERDASGELALLGVRRCSDWTGRERWTTSRGAWFILREGAVVAFDHWSFGPRCSVANAFAPAPPALLETERTLRSFLEQRHPPAPPPLAIRFRRGLAYLAAGRRAEARAELGAGEQALAARRSLFEQRDATPAEQELFARESAELRGLRDELSAALARAERGD